MHFLGLLVLAVAKALHFLIVLYQWIVAFAVIVSWVNPDPYNPIIRFLYQATSPVFRQVRRMMPRSVAGIGFDITPILVFIVLIFADTLLVGLLFELSNRLLSK